MQKCDGTFCQLVLIAPKFAMAVLNCSLVLGIFNCFVERHLRSTYRRSTNFQSSDV
jgi:hypothetical protein